MCSRFAYLGFSEALADELDLIAGWDFPPMYNVAPNQFAPVIRRDPESSQNRMTKMKWSLIPSWSKEPTVKYATFNARSEDIEKKPAFRSAVKAGRRCLVPADCFYEWKQISGQKQPYWIGLENGEKFFMAGYWERWTKEEETLDSFTILTVPSNELVSELHEKKRMPVIFTRIDDCLHWLRPDQKPEDLQPLIRPYSAEAMKAYPVSKKVGNVRYKEKDSIEPEGKELHFVRSANRVE